MNPYTVWHVCGDETGAEYRAMLLRQAGYQTRIRKSKKSTLIKVEARMKDQNITLTKRHYYKPIQPSQKITFQAIWDA